MSEETSSSSDLLTAKGLVNVHLFNCDRTYNLESVEKLLKDVEAKAKCEFSISKHYFPLPKMAETCAELAEYQMDFAVFVVHANESRLSLNEERAGIGYAKIYRALLAATGNRVLIVIGGDEYYEGEEEIQVLSLWAKMKILSQFSPEYLDGRKSFIFSWETKHRLIHEDAVLHFLDPVKQGQVFVPEVRSAPKLEHLETEKSESGDTIKNEDKFGSNTESNVSSVRLPASVQQNVNIHSKPTADFASPCTSEDPSLKLKLEEKGTEEKQFAAHFVERDNYNKNSQKSQDVPSGADFGKIERSDNPTSRPDGRLFRMIVSLEHGEIKEIMKTNPDDWEPPPELLSGLKKLYHDTPFIYKVEIWEEEGGSNSIKILPTKLERFSKMMKQIIFTK